MRDFGKVAPTFWTRGTGKTMRGCPEAQLVALYLMSAPGANMIGLFYCPLPTIAHDTGLPLEGASKGLARACEGGLCTFDKGSETVFVHTMARRQLGLEEGEALSPKDNRVKGIVRMLRECDNSRLLQAFWDLYHVTLCLPDPWWTQHDMQPLASPSEGPSKPLRSQEIGDRRLREETETREGVQGEQAPATLALTPDAPKSKKGKRPLTAMPDGWEPKLSHVEKAKELGIDLATEADRFRTDAAAKSRIYADWDAAFRNWLTSPFQQSGPSSHPRINGSAHQPGKCTPVRPIEEILAAGEAKKAREATHG